MARDSISLALDCNGGNMSETFNRAKLPRKYGHSHDPLRISKDITEQ